jgi:hypothetical protein
MMQLIKSQRDYEKDDKSKLQSIDMPDGTKMPVIFKEGKVFDVSGAPIDLNKISATQQQADMSDKAQMSAVSGIPTPPEDYFGRISPKNREKVKLQERDRSAKLLDKLDSENSPVNIANDMSSIKQFIDLNYAHQDVTGPVVGKLPMQIVSEPVAIMDKIGIEQSRKMRQPGEGATSDFDAKQFAKASLSTSNRYDTNRVIATAALGKKQNELDYKQFRREYLENNDTLAFADKYWREYVEANPIFDESDPDNFKLNPNRKNYKDWFREKFSQKPKKVTRGPDGTLSLGEE